MEIWLWVRKGKGHSPDDEIFFSQIMKKTVCQYQMKGLCACYTTEASIIQILRAVDVPVGRGTQP